MKLSGYAGKILRINLASKTFDVEELETSVYKSYLGSRGLGAYLLSKNLQPQVDPLSPENPLIFMTGPLTGTKFLSTPKYAAVTKSPLTGFYTESLASGKFGLNLKSLGYDGILITGKADKPTYISMTKEGVLFHDAGFLWGMNIYDTIFSLQEKAGSPAEVLCIGPAGENLVPLACAFSGRRTLGRGGIGAVMGSKSLKAIVLSEGAKKVNLFDPKEFERLFKKNLKRQKELNISNSPLAKLGTSCYLLIINELGMMPTCNFKFGTFKMVDEICGERLKEDHFIDGRVCSKCLISCEKTSITRGDTFAETTVRGPEYETLWALGPQCGIGDLNTIIVCSRLCDELGVDTISMGVSIGFAMELFERGLLSEKDMDGLCLKFGNGKAMIELIKKVGLGHDIGRVFGRGVRRLAQEIQNDTEQYAMHVKGMEIPGYDPRGAVGMGLAYATSSRGACHLKAWTIRKEAIEQPETRYSYENKAQMVKEMQDYRSAIDCSGLCINAAGGVDPEGLACLVSSVTGLDLSESGLKEIGERVWNLERMLAISEGITRKDDTLPARFFQESLPDGSAKGAVMQKEGFEKMLSEFYELRGWDVKTGIPIETTLKRLNLI